MAYGPMIQQDYQNDRLRSSKREFPISPQIPALNSR